MSTNTSVLGFRTAQMMISANLANLTQEESLIQPAQSGNCLNWLAGHILISREAVKQILGIQLPAALSADESRPYQQGSTPLRDPELAVPLDRLVAHLESSSASIVSRIQSLSDEELAAAVRPEMFPIPVDSPNLANLLTLFVFHEAYHSGQIGLGRRLLGKNPGLPI